MAWNVCNSIDDYQSGTKLPHSIGFADSGVKGRADKFISQSSGVRDSPNVHRHPRRSPRPLSRSTQDKPAPPTRNNAKSIRTAFDLIHSLQTRAASDRYGSKSLRLAKRRQLGGRTVPHRRWFD